MAAVTTSSKSKGPIVNPALCRCCRSIKRCRLLTAEYDWNGSKEVYSDMFMDCFGLMLTHLGSNDPRYSCICATCVVRLRDAGAFRRQVLQCQQAFMNANIERSERESKVNLTLNIKIEPECGNASDCDGDGNRSDMEDIDLGTLCHPTGEDKEPLPEPIQDSKPDIPTNSEVKMNLLDKQRVTSKPELTVKVKKKLETKHASIKLKSEGNYCEKEKKRASIKKNLDGKLDHKYYKFTKKIVQPPPPKKPKVTRYIKRTVEEDMMYKNALTIACNSYVTPFSCRIAAYYCYYCRDQFTDPAELREHTLTHDPGKLFQKMIHRNMPKIDITRIDCRLCEEKIHDLSTLKKHLAEIHRLEIFNVTNEFLTFKLELKEVTCTECGATFPYFELLKRHMIEHFPSFICDQCGACFCEKRSLRSHIYNHNKKEVLFPCKICGKNLKSKYKMMQHALTVHEKKPSMHCYKCDAMFMSHFKRVTHMIEVHGDKRTFTCKICDKVYNRRKSLASHNRFSHSKVFKHQCNLCDQKFYVPSRLKDHMATHTGLWNYRCEICQKAYRRLKSLKGHMKIHSNDRTE